MSKYPHIKFVYSWSLDDALASTRGESINTERERKQRGYLPILQAKWDKMEKQVWLQIKTLTETLPPCVEEIKCYIVTYISLAVSGISSPLILETKRLLEKKKTDGISFWC